MCDEPGSSETAASLERANETCVSSGEGLTADLIDIPTITFILKKGMFVNYVAHGGSKKSLKIISVADSRR
jgi:hypothetical protein